MVLKIVNKIVREKKRTAEMFEFEIKSKSGNALGYNT